MKPAKWMNDQKITWQDLIGFSLFAVALIAILGGIGFVAYRNATKPTPPPLKISIDADAIAEKTGHASKKFKDSFMKGWKEAAEENSE